MTLYQQACHHQLKVLEIVPGRELLRQPDWHSASPSAPPVSCAAASAGTNGDNVIMHGSGMVQVLRHIMHLANSLLIMPVAPAAAVPWTFHKKAFQAASI